MSIILINASNLKKGGGLQVADSLCGCLNKYLEHSFVVVVSDSLDNIVAAIDSYPNVKVLKYNSDKGLKVMLTGRNTFLDKIIEKYKVDVVLSIFGPCIWTPRRPQLCGFARSHLVLVDSPYFTRMTRLQRLKAKFHNMVLTYFFQRGVTAFYTENTYITEKWKRKVKDKEVYTVTNYYNQLYDNPMLWKEHTLPHFDGVTMLCISASYPHKNLEIAIEIAKKFKQKRPEFNFRFVFTIDETEYPFLEKDLRHHFCFIGRTNISEGPTLYRQADIMFQPSLLECFSATFPEAMRMEVPIVTSDLKFARGLCEEAAVYYSSVDAEAAADALYRVATDESLRKELIELGKKQLQRFDNYTQRADKLIALAEGLIQKNNK